MKSKRKTKVCAVTFSVMVFFAIYFFVMVFITEELRGSNLWRIDRKRSFNLILRTLKLFTWLQKYITNF